jgi:DNA-binding NarL/FixJ family response regulator
LVKLFLVHADRLLAEVLADAFGRCQEAELVGFAPTPQEALSRIAILDLSVALVDVGLGGEQTIALIQGLRQNYPELVILPMDLDSESEVVAYLEAGAGGYVMRNTSFSGLLNTILAANRGEPLCSPEVASAVCSRLAHLARTCPPSGSSPEVSLTPREEQVLGLVSEGLRNKEIASRLRITLPTVKNHVHNILDKLQVHRRREAIHRAYELGLLNGASLPASSLFLLL